MKSDSDAATADASSDQGSASIDELIRATESTEWRARWDAVNELGKLKDPSRNIPDGTHHLDARTILG